MSNPNSNPDKAKAEPKRNAEPYEDTGAQPGWHPETRRNDHGKKPVAK